MKLWKRLRNSTHLTTRRKNKRLETLLRLGAVVLVENVSAVNADEEGIPETG